MGPGGENDSDLDIKIDPVIDAKPQGLVDRALAWWTGRKIKIVDQPTQPDDLDDLVQILSDANLQDNPKITIGQTQAEETPIELSIEPVMRLAVTTQANVAAAQQFFANIRHVTPELVRSQGIVPTHQEYTGHQWYGLPDLIALADRWNLPFACLNVGGAHWNLVLRPPEKGPNGYRVLVYDPMHNDEAWIELPSWDGSYSTANKYGNGFYENALAAEQLTSGDYNLSLYGDEELAAESELYRAKMTRVQLIGDGSNCGPACLFMAALREGVKTGWNAFKYAGREQLQTDIGLTILTREEILQQ